MQRTPREPFGPEPGLLTIALAPDYTTTNKDARTGRGYVVYPNGTIYEGQWERGERSGLGVCYYESGNIYVGQFVAGRMEGEGTMFFASGDFFTGEFRNSQIHRGIFSSGGEEISGVWEKGVRVVAEPIASPDALRRAHAALFSAIVTRVHEHFRSYGKEGGIGTAVGPASSASFLMPPVDVFTQEGPAGGSRYRRSAAAPSSTRAMSQLSPMPPLESPPLGGPPDDMSVISERPRRAGSAHGGEDPGSLDQRAGVTNPLPPESIFVGASPRCNECFSLSRCEARVCVFLFPFLSLPWVPFAPFRITALDEEREFVVSGGTLGRDFDPPTSAIVAVAVAVCCQVASIVIVACRVALGRAQDGRLTLPEMVIPCVLWLVVALFCGAYNAYYNIPHALERMNRKLTPRLTAHAASVVDSRARVCIYTWDDEGRGKVRNRHYRYRWALISMVFGALMSLSAPLTRRGFGHAMFGRDGFQMAASLLAFFATFLFSTVLTYYVLKLTDMQREVRAKMRVLTHLAYLDGRSIVAPSVNMRQPFLLDLSFDPTNLFSGFPGWYAARSIVLYASSCANHHSRSAAMSVFTVVIFSASIVSLSDVFKALAEGRLRSQADFSTAHSYGVFVLFFWGLLLFRYYFACGMTMRELDQHHFIMDCASLHHRVRLRSTDAAEVIHMCSEMAKRYDAVPYFFRGPLSPLLGAFFVTLNIAGLIAVAFQLAEVIRYRGL